MGRQVRRRAGMSGLAASLDDMHAPANLHAFVEIDHVVVEHAHAAARHGLADRPRLVRAVDAEHGVVAVLVEIDGARAERIVQTARQTAESIAEELRA